MSTKSPRDEILMHADSVFARFGYRRANMGDVAKAAGISRQGLYHYFPTKEALFVADVDRIHADTIADAQAARDAANARHASLSEIVADMLDARFGSLQRRVKLTPHTDELLEEAARRCNHIVSRHARRFHLMLVNLIEDEIGAGGVALADETTPDDLASVFATIARGVNIAQPAPDLSHLREVYLRHVKLVVNGAIRENRRG